MADGPFIYRFSRDLRLDDHAGLAAAAARGTVLPLLVIDRTLEARLARSPRRAAFFCAAVRALDGELRERGSALIVRRGAAGATIKNVANAVGAGGAAWSASYDGVAVQSDARLQSELEEAGLIATIVHDGPAIGPEETAAARSIAGQGYRAFAPYYEAWCELPVPSYEQPVLLRFAPTELHSEPLPVPNEFGAGDREAEAGPAVARDALVRFMRDGVTQYALAAMLPSDDRTSHLAPHLSFGTLSARTVVREVRTRLAEDAFLLAEERQSLRRYLRALAHRDFFLQLSWFHPQTETQALQEKMQGFSFERSHAALDAWRGGNTGFPLVDAGIRQLHETGWMHPHVRAVAASFLCFDLGVDWRIGRDEWERWLIEDDPALATGNWQWIAGVGADMAQYPRIYNPERQRRRYDPDGRYVRRWIRELEHVPIGIWHGGRADSSQLVLELFSPQRYPSPAVDHERAAREFLARYRAFVNPRETRFSSGSSTDRPAVADRSSR
ncbi:MAG: deoxyribodipyrimidine photo-lyase [Candidatus Eremiobacteraeota bacterium]|nr:deoxyribodipyrimidine photo-lyase [Candidatus Eremiobacteraeota bacterium]